jgi:hypothetical protein
MIEYMRADSSWDVIEVQRAKGEVQKFNNYASR